MLQQDCSQSLALGLSAASQTLTRWSPGSLICTLASPLRKRKRLDFAPGDATAELPVGSAAEEWRRAWADCARALTHACSVAPSGDAPHRDEMPFAASQVKSWAGRRMQELHTDDAAVPMPIGALHSFVNMSIVYVQDFSRAQLREQLSELEVQLARADLDEKLRAGALGPQLAPLLVRYGPAALRRQLDRLPALEAAVPAEDDDVVDVPLLSTKLIESQLSAVAKLAERAMQWRHALAASDLPGPALMPTLIITHVPSTPGETPLVSSPGRAPASMPAPRVPPPLRGEATVHVQRRASDGAVDGVEVHLRIENGGHEPRSVSRIAYTEVLDDDGAPMAAGRRTILATNEVCATSTSLSRAGTSRLGGTLGGIHPAASPCSQLHPRRCG